MSDKTYTLQELADAIKAEVKGDPSCKIFSMAPIETAHEGQITFLLRPKFKRYLDQSQASAVVLHPNYIERCQTNALIVNQPEVAYAKLATLFDRSPKPKKGVHPSVVIGENVHLPESCVVGPNVVIGNHVTVGENVVIGANSVISDDSHIGDNTKLFPNVTLYHDVQIGERCIVHSGVVIGSDGFGMVNDHGAWLKIPQLGGVRIGNDVEIGANTTIDRGAMQNTVIGNGVKLDNQIQVAHNVQIGDHTAIAGCVAIAGSAKIGKYCMIGGGSCIADHLEIADHVMIAGMSGVSKSLKEPDIYASGIPVQRRDQWHKNIVNYRKLGDLLDRVRQLEKVIDESSRD